MRRRCRLDLVKVAYAKAFNIEEDVDNIESVKTRCGRSLAHHVIGVLADSVAVLQLTTRSCWRRGQHSGFLVGCVHDELLIPSVVSGKAFFIGNRPLKRERQRDNSNKMTQDHVLKVGDSERSRRVKEIKPEVYLRDVLAQWTLMRSRPMERTWCTTMSLR
jgi:hypothetical protein